MIEEQYVSFDTAKMLNEAGFDTPCRGIYRTNRIGHHEFRECVYLNRKDDLSWDSNDGFQYEYLAPTQALAARWLREAHGIHVFSFFQYHTQRWVYYVANLSAPCAEIGMIFSENDYDNYENAMEDGLREAIKQIKK